MVNLIFNYLLESSLVLILFVVTYRLLIANMTDFSWMRFYLLVSMVLSVMLPLIIIPVEWPAQFIQADFFPGKLTRADQALTTPVNDQPGFIQAAPGISLLNRMLFIAFIIYVIGIVYTSCLFAGNLIKVNGFIKKSDKVKEQNYWIVSLKSELPAFSFFNYIFINNTYKNLSSSEQQVIKEHEMAHAKHYHTLDVLFAELVGILFWFNPAVNYLKRSLKEIHEYSVDEKIAGQGETKKAYAQLLLSLASDTKAFNLATSFAGEPVKSRILMLAKPRTSPKHKLMFMIIVPLTAVLLVSFSYLKRPKANSKAAGIRLELEKYCGVYSPSKKESHSLAPMEITLKNNKLFANGTVELQFESDTIFSYADNRGRRILFFLDSKKDFMDNKEVTGCALVNLVTQGHKQYLALEGGEYLKRQPGQSEE